MSYTIRKIMAFSAGIAITFNVLSVNDIGAVNDVSLQAPEMEITTAEPVDYVPSAIIVSNSHISAEVTEKTDDIDDRTFTIDLDEEADDALEDGEFVRDGSHLWVNVDIANLRSEPSTDSDVLTQITYSSDIIRVSYSNEWSLVRLDDGTEGYVLSSLLSEDEIVLPTATPTPLPTATPTPMPTATPTPIPTATPAPTQGPAYTETSMSATVYASCVMNVRSGPGTEYSLVTGLNPGDTITVTASTDNGWYRTSDGYYVKADLCLDQAPAAPVAPTGGSSATAVDPSGFSDFGSYCLQFVGTPYVYSGASPSGFDCSGFVSYIYANYYGISLPHNAADISELGSGVSADSVQVGDVLCHDYNNDGYIDHVSLYIGNGTCVHASNSRMGVITANWPMGSVVTIRRFT